MKRIGIIGFGFIGSYLFNKIREEKLIEVDFICEKDRTKVRSLDPSLLLDTLDTFEERKVDLVIEAALPQAVKEFGPRILRKADFLILSLTSLADDSFRREMEKTARTWGKKVYIPHGAIIGLDGVHDGKEVIEKVRITTIKSPKSLGLKGESPTEPTIIYEGPTGGACERFPRNVNVHASLALTGLGFERTESKIVADPGKTSMVHIIEVTGRGLRWKVEIESSAVGEVTGAYTPESIFHTVKRICGQEGGFCLA